MFEKYRIVFCLTVFIVVIAEGPKERERRAWGGVRKEGKQKKGTCFVITPYNAYRTSKRQEGL